MDYLGNEYAAMVMHQARIQEMMEQAETKRTLRGMRESVERRVRRVVRINNDHVR